LVDLTILIQARSASLKLSGGRSQSQLLFQMVDIPLVSSLEQGTSSSLEFADGGIFELRRNRRQVRAYDEMESNYSLVIDGTPLLTWTPKLIWGFRKTGAIADHPKGVR
jgi:hypothetical protein